MAKRTIENCSLIRKHGKPNMDNGKCVGFGTENDDEPCETCKNCKLNNTYEQIESITKGEYCRRCPQSYSTRHGNLRCYRTHEIVVDTIGRGTVNAMRCN
jgi:hypothetical protein